MKTQPLMIPQIQWSHNHPQRVYLARHGQSVSNCEGRIAGQLNPPLTEKGRRQALRISRALQNIRLTKVVTSSLSRTIDTATPTAEWQGLPVCPLMEINEISFGILEGRLRHRLDQASRDLLDRWTKDKANFRIPNGESLSDVWKRVVPALSSVFRDTPGGTVLIVGHRHTNLVILSVLLGWDLRSLVNTPIQSKYLYEFHYGPTPQIHTICLTGDARGRRVEGFLSGDDAMNVSKEHCHGS